MSYRIHHNHHTIGGFNFDMKLTDLLASRFNEAWNKKASGRGKDVRDFFRPMTRLRLEANKVMVYSVWYIVYGVFMVCSTISTNLLFSFFAYR
ncbi:hypothetical protein EON63_04805 [archaeon]|nr:MAG: hypothetical protein EON63_04805 [archaeon]